MAAVNPVPFAIAKPVVTLWLHSLAFEIISDRTEFPTATVYVVTNQFGYASDPSCYAGNFHCHSFHQNHRNAFGEAGQSKNVRLMVKIQDAVGVLAAFEDNVPT